LQESEEQYRLLTETAQEGIYQLDSSANYIFVNEAFAKILGYTREELLGKNATIVIPEHGREQATTIPEGVSPDNPSRGEFTLTHKSGHEIPVYYSMVPQKKQGQITGFTGTIINITERKRAEIALKKAHDELEKRVKERTDNLKAVNEQMKQEITERKLSEERIKKVENSLNNIIESSLDGIAVSDDLGYVTRTNKSFLKIVGYEQKEIIGTHIMELSVTEAGNYESTTGEPVEITDEFLLLQWEMIEKLFEEGKISNWESYYRRKDKKIVPVEVNIAYLYNEEGDIIGSVGINRDITERRKAEKEIREAKEYLENLFKTSSDAIMVTDPQGTITMVNDAMEKIVGYSRDELLKMHAVNLAPKGKVYERGKEFAIKLFEDGIITRFENAWIRKDGSIVEIEINAALLKDSDGTTTGAVASVRDITERKRVEREIREARDFLENIFKTSADGIIITDPQGTITGVNNAVEKMLGYTQEELIGKHVAEFSSTTKQYREEGQTMIAQLMEEGSVTEMERMWNRKDGTVVNIEVNMSLLRDKDGTIRGAVGGVRDITERKRVEREIREAREFLENIISTTLDGIIIVDPQGTITRANEAVEKMLGYTQEELKNMHMSQLGDFGDDFRLWLRRDMVGKLFEHGRYKEFEAWWKRKDGKPLSIELNAALLKNKEGEIIGGVVGVRDNSERKKIQEIEMKNVFISNISHEFRTPLTLSIGPLEGILRGEHGYIGTGTKDQIGLALRNNRRLLKLVNQLLEFTRLGSKSEDVSYYKKDINQFLSAIVDSFVFLAKKKDITLHFIPGKGSEPVYIDPGKMERVLLNIIGNAFKFTPRGGSIIIDIENGKEEVEGNFIKISVKDTGIGIKEEDLSHVFERFQQVDGSSSRRHEGTGIGLSLAKDLIELQGGKIKAESEYGRGSTFTIYIPMGKDHISNQSQINEERDEIVLTQKEIELSDLGYDEIKIREGKPTGEKPLILFIDDNLDVRRYVTGILGKKYEVITAEDGLKGLEKLKEYIPDLIISDIMMPGMDGYQFCQSVKSNPELRHIPLIFLTAKADTAFKIESLEEGADDYIVKPFNSQELLARVKSMLRMQELIRENILKEKKVAELTEILGERHQYHRLIGKSEPMQEIYRLLEKIKKSESTVLIFGETGTGKELVAHAVQNNSKRKDNPFIILNCTAISKNLLESELFGHIKGAFTGATADKKGIFEVANGGTLFFDEIAEMSLATQVKLLRVLEEGTFLPVGSSEEKKVSVRIIAATNKDLRKLIDKGRFREDLYYRINVININLPPLRERREDVPLLVEHFIKESNGKKGDKKKLSERG